MAAGAELGAKYMITSAYDPDLGRFTDRLAAVSDLASQYGLRAVLEFFPWTGVPDLGSAVRIVEAAERPAARNPGGHASLQPIGEHIR